MQNESQKHDLNSYPSIRHGESFMLPTLIKLQVQIEFGHYFTIHPWWETYFNKGKYRIQINANWKTFEKKNLIVQQIEKLRRKNTRKPYLPDWTRPLRIQRLIFMGEKNFFTLTEDNNGPNAVTKVDNGDYVRRRWELIITGKVRIIFEKIDTRLKWMW